MANLPTDSLSIERSALTKKTTHAAAFIGHVEAATNVNEVGGQVSIVTPDSSSTGGAAPLPVLQPRKKQYIGDKEKERKWIRGYISMKICRSFQENPKQKDFCMCGRRKLKEHMPAALEDIYQGKWSAESDECVTTMPTAAYGEIEFPNANIAKFVRVAEDTEMDDMMYLLTNVWGLQKPNLLISVTGGAKNITMSKKLKDAFKNGLLKTAQTTGAWILSGGNNDGVMKYVGEAVNMLQSSRKVVAFGIAPWGCVANKRELSSPEGVWPAYYQLRDDASKVGSKNANLDPNHTHFILVDNGTFRKFGTEINFRGMFEKQVSRMLTDADEASATNVPVVSIVVEGGPGTLTTVRAAIDNATPVVILDGSGRAADMLAYAYNNTEEEDVTTYNAKGKSIVEKVPKLSDEIKKKLRTMVEDEWPNKDHDELVQTIIHCVMRRHLIVIFSLDGKNTMKDIDIAILHAIMKANKNDAMNQLKLALAWNRIDVVREEIFTEDKKWDSKELEDILLTAMIQNKADFVDLLMDHIHLGNFVTKKRLLELYNDTPKNHLLYRLLMAQKDKVKNTVSLADVGEVIQTLVGDFYNPLYIRESRYFNLDSDEILGLSKTHKIGRTNPKRWLHHRNTFARFGDSSESEDEDSPLDLATLGVGVGAAIGARPLDKAKHKSQVVPTEVSHTSKRVYNFDWPARELFIWCVLMRRRDLSMLFLQEEKYAIAPALTAAIMLRNMVNQDSTIDAEVGKEIESLAKEFEDIAIGVLGECFVADELKSKHLLIRVIPSYGETTLLQLAVQAGNKEFVSHQVCQNLLNNIWWGKMDELQGEWRLFLCLLCPPLLFGVIQFRHQDELKEKDRLRKKKPPKKKQVLANPEALQTRKTLDERGLTRLNEDLDPEASGESAEKQEEELLTFYSMIEAFYNAPKITFILNTGFYLAFLVLFTYMMLSNFHPADVTTYTNVECIIAIWVITLFIEELRQFWVAETNSFFMKLKNYFSDVWNLVDIATVTLFVIGYTLRIIDHKLMVEQETLRLKADLLESGGRDVVDAWQYQRDDDAAMVENRLSYSRVILCLALMTFWFRILHIFSVIRILGPKLVMIGRMIKDLLSFGVILAVFMAAFGIAQHAIMYPNEPASGLLVYRVLRMSYWQMYGELFLDEIEGENEGSCVQPCTQDQQCFSVRDFLVDHTLNRTCQDSSDPIDLMGNCTDGSDLACYGVAAAVPKGLPLTAFPSDLIAFCYNSTLTIPECNSDQDRCPEVNRIVPVMLGVYILFTQILMFNLLIAMFSYTFTLVQENTDMHWKFQQYAMIKEYYTRPPVPPPFIVINHLALFIRWIYRMCKTDDHPVGDDFKMFMDDQPEKQLAVWERINYEDYCRKQQNVEEASVEYKVSRSKCDLDVLVSTADAVGNLPKLYERMSVVETRLNDTSEALNWIMDALSSNKMGKGKPPIMKIAQDEVTRQEVLDAEEKIFDEWKAKKDGFVHIKCRASPYFRASRIRRFPVPNTKVYWEIDWPGYQPVRYTSDEILSVKEANSDPDIFKMSVAEVDDMFKFNSQEDKICRVSFHGTYQLDKMRLPLNPFGRTGLSGRGLLKRWGPNHALDAIVSRWKRFPDGDLELRNDKKVLEFIGVKRSDVDEWSLPGLMADMNRDSREGMALTAIKEKAFGDCMTEDCKAALESIANPRVIYEGYCDDPRNTDNAWIETLAYNFHDETSEVTNEMVLKPGHRVTKVGWIEASDDLVLFAGHGMIVEKLIAMHNAAS